jgi:hypothetical protein
MKTIAAAGVLLSLALPVGAFDPIALPPELARYRSWEATTNAPYLVPEHVSTLCAPVVRERPVEPAPEAGLHAGRFIRVYANAAAQPALATAARPAAAGAVIAKEKLSKADDTEPVAAAFMVRRDEARFRETGGWEFLFYPPSRDPEATHRGCAACHRNARDGGYVFGHAGLR